MSTNVPAPTLGAAGFEAPAEADILAGVLADLSAAFGGALNTALNTPQGQIATSLSAIIGAANDLYLLITNQVDPQYASGRMQDAIARIYFLDRNPPLPTAVTAIATGAAGTVIPAGSLAQSTNGNIYQSLDDAVIAGSGTVSIAFASLATGPIACPAGTLARIYRAVPGWDAVTNPTDGVPGRDDESRADFEARRAASVALNAVGVLPAMRAAVLNVDGVLDAFVSENSSAAPRVVQGVTLPAHSLYVAVAGGADSDVARAIWAKKNPGCDYFGNTTVTVRDLTSGYTPPYPEYPVTFQRPAAAPIFYNITLANNANVPADAVARVRAVVQAAFNGQDGGPRARIGGTLYASRVYAGIAALGPWANIVSVRVGTTGPANSDAVTVRADQLPTLNDANILVQLT